MAWCIGLWILISSLTYPCVLSSSSHDEHPTIAMLHQEAEYHLRGLSNVLKQLQSPHRLFKRETRHLTINASSTIRDICSVLHSEFPTDTTENIYTTDSTPEDQNAAGDSLTKEVENIDFEGKDHPSKWKLPKLFIESVEVKQGGEVNMTQITFNVTHSAQAFVLRLFTLDNLRKDIGDPGKYESPISSTVRLSINASDCFDPRMDAKFAFGLVEDKSIVQRTVVDFCRVTQLHPVQVRNLSELENVDENRESQKFQTPKFRIVGMPSTSNNDNEIIITQGETAQFEIDLFYPSSETRIRLGYIFWDWEKKKMFREETSTSANEMYGFSISDFVNYSVIHRTVLNRTDALNASNVDESRIVVLRIKLTVNFGSKKMSGQFILVHDWVSYSNSLSRPLSLRLRTRREVYFRLPDKIAALPQDYLEILMSRKSECRNDGHQQSKSSCVINCFADGTDIRTIFIAKLSPYKAPIKWASNILNGFEAYAAIDMGPPSSEIEGNYRCAAMTGNGQIKTSDTSLTTQGFPLIHSTNVTDFGNGTTRLTCEVSGFKPLGVDISTLDRYHDYQRNVQILGSTLENVDNKTIRNVLIDTNKLIFPTRYVICETFNERGTDRKRVDVWPYIDSYNHTAPLVVSEKFRLEELDNGTSRIFCTAVGGQNVSIMIEAEGENGRYVVKNKPGTVWTEIKREHGKTVVLDVPTKYLPKLDNGPGIICLATNTLGRTSERILWENVKAIYKV